MGTSISIYVDNSTSTPENAYYTYFDTPSTTSQITYKVAVYQGTGSSYEYRICKIHPTERRVIQITTNMKEAFLLLASQRYTGITNGVYRH